MGYASLHLDTLQSFTMHWNSPAKLLISTTSSMALIYDSIWGFPWVFLFFDFDLNSIFALKDFETSSTPSFFLLLLTQWWLTLGAYLWFIVWITHWTVWEKSLDTRLLRRMLDDWAETECWGWGLSCDWVVSRELSSLRPLPGPGSLRPLLHLVTEGLSGHLNSWLICLRNDKLVSDRLTKLSL